MKFFPKQYLAVVMTAACPSLFAADIEEVIITASPFAKSAESVNKPVNLLSGKQLLHAASATLGETLNGQLGVSSASFGPGVGLPVIRGQSDNRVKVMQNSIGSMDASAASPDHAVALEPLLATKIEVLRGPSALRYGSGAIGGVVNVLDNRIPDKLPEGPSGGAELRNASVNDETVAVASLNSAVGDIAFHIDGVKRSSNDINIPGFAEKNSADPSQGSKGYIANTDAKSNSGTFGASYIIEDGFIGASVNKLDNNYGVPPEGDDLVRIDMQQTRYDIKGELNNPFAGLEKISLRVGHNDYQHTEMENGVPGTKFINDAYEGRAELLHSPLNLFSMKWNGAIGVQAAQSTFAALGDEAFIPKSDINNLGFFIIEESTHNDWTYEVGARVDAQKITPDIHKAVNHNSSNLSATTTWHFSEQQQMSFGLAKSQRAPSIEELFANGPHPATGSYLVGNTNLNEETSNNIELGYHWHGDTLQFSTNIFYNQVKDFIYSSYETNPPGNVCEDSEELNCYIYSQANATFRGFETVLKIPFYDYWNLRLFSDKVVATLDKGGDLPRITPMRLGSSLDFNFKRWNAAISATHVMKQEHPGNNESETESYNRLDIRLDYNLKHANADYTIFLKATNVANTEIRNAASYLRDIAPEPGRNLQAGIRVRF